MGLHPDRRHGISTKKLVVVIGAYFNDEIATLTKKFVKVGWFIGGAIISVTFSLIANLVVALLAK